MSQKGFPMSSTHTREKMLRYFRIQDALRRGELPLDGLEYVGREVDPPIRVYTGRGSPEVCSGTFACECSRCQNCETPEPQPGDFNDGVWLGVALSCGVLLWGVVIFALAKAAGE